MASLQIADHWFEMRRVDDAITLLWEPHVTPFMRCNIWHVAGRDRDLLIDTGTGIASLAEAMRHLIDKPVLAVATHTHADHVGGHHEFEHCLVHRLEAEGLRRPARRFTLIGPDFDGNDLHSMQVPGCEGPLITALPRAGYSLTEYRVRAARVTRELVDGDVVDTGRRHFEVLHLPGHSPGSIGLWEPSTGTLFSGDAIYDGGLLDQFEHSNRDDYRRTMARLRDLPVSVVHAGHAFSFGRDRMRQLVDDYLDHFI